jgi:hypothetical protein
VCFAACVSRLGEDNVGNDLLGFSHAVIASGASTFLGGLWQINDLATIILMIFFHRAIKEQKSDVSLAACWRQAQVRLYELTKPKLRVLLEELIKIWDEAVHDGKILPGTSPQARADIRNILEEDEECDFTHPFYWAAFVLVGRGSLLLVNEDVKIRSAAEPSSRIEKHQIVDSTIVHQDDAEVTSSNMYSCHALANGHRGATARTAMFLTQTLTRLGFIQTPLAAGSIRLSWVNVRSHPRVS